MSYSCATSRNVPGCLKTLELATRKDVAGAAVYTSECDVQQATALLEMARGPCAPAVKDIEHAIFAATAG